MIAARVNAERVIRARNRWLTLAHWASIVADAILWGALLMAASGLGLLLEAIADTIRYGAPR
jgi:hypothetical protein